MQISGSRFAEQDSITLNDRQNAFIAGCGLYHNFFVFQFLPQCGRNCFIRNDLDVRKRPCTELDKLFCFIIDSAILRQANLSPFLCQNIVQRYGFFFLRSVRFRLCLGLGRCIAARG